MMTTLSAPTEELLREQVASGEFDSVDSAIEAAVKTVFGRQATKALESLLDEALADQGDKVPVAALRRRA